MSADIGQQVQQLYSQFGDIPGITIEIHKSLLAINVLNDSAEATVFIQGAQVSHYKAHPQPACLWLSPECEYKTGQSLRGGIPLCWPWFGQLDKNPEAIRLQVPGDQAPAHGFVRERDWCVDSIIADSSHSTRLTLSLDIAADDEPLWPFNCRLEMEIVIADTLSIQFRVHNHSGKTMHYSTALHSYFAVNHIDHVSVSGLDQSEYLDCLDDWQSKNQQGPLTITSEVDRLYFPSEPIITINDQKTQRRLLIESQNSHSAVLWNPWIDKAKRLSAFADAAYREMLCVETANAGKDYVSLDDGQSHELKLTISSQSQQH